MKFLSIIIILLSFSAFSQKKVIDHTIYNDWKKIGDIQLSENGSYTVYTSKPHRGDGFLYLVNNKTGKIDSIFRAVNPKFTADSKVLLFKLTPHFDSLRKCELNKVKKDKWPKDSLGVWYLESDSLIKISKIKEFDVSEKGGTFAYLSFDNEFPNFKVKKEKKKKRKNKKEVEKPSSEGNFLTILNSESTFKHEMKNISSFKLSEKGEKLAYVVHLKHKTDSSFISVLDLNVKKSDKTFFKSYNSISSYNFDKLGNKLTYLASQDTVKDSKIYQLHMYDFNSDKESLLVDVLQGDLALSKSVSKNFEPYFSLDETKIYFGIADKPRVEPKDTLLESEKAKLDLWHWKDDRLQPQQLLEQKRDEKETQFAYFDLVKNEFKIIENDSVKIYHNKKNATKFVLGYNENPYQDKYNWEYPNKVDVYRVNIETGEQILLRKSSIYGTSLSPSGHYFTYFNEKDLQQYVFDIENNVTQCITCSVKAEWLEDVNGMPITPNPFGILDFLNGEKELLVKAKYNTYLYNIPKNSLKALFEEKAGEKVRYSWNYWDRDSTYFHFENSYITRFNEKDKSEAIYLPKWHDEHLDLILVDHSNHTYSGIKKAKRAHEIVFQKASAQDYPDLYLSSTTGTALSKISTINPQQKEYNWTKVELVSWKSYSGIPLEGLLYKPENYDSTKAYPLLVYFYEMYSDELHNHYVPKPTASIIYPTEYTSAGYLVFIPDIRYKAGYPARGAYDCIMSGTDYLLKKYKNIDSTRMGLQGQSWGGYQTAQLITMTKRYKAAMAGAPVSNMFSAYGGIRWGSGLNRQFQYERTQSRIGKTIWEAPELYVENSPLFHLPNIETPLLIMHNDADGAVPWYQGIELFTGLKRLGKPVWMLNYNGDDHNLMKNANRFDLSIRMRQFFDHYLLGAPAPIWLEDGLPAIKKGKTYHLDLK